MTRSLLSLVASSLVAVAALSFDTSAALAQNGDQKPGEDKGAQGEAKKGNAKREEVAEAERLLKGLAGQPECLWVGRRIVSLIWRDDLDTASRHRELYERFGCPSAHVQNAFRCLVRQGDLDPKVPESLNERVHACWINPDMQPSDAAPPTTAAAAAPATPPPP
jgi:hypothetical protein